MKRYRSFFKEWQPEKFQYAREIGLLDNSKKIKKEIPDYLIEFFRFYSKVSIEDLNNINFLKNKIKSLEDRIIIWDNNFYTCNSNRFIHQVIVAYLVLHEGLVLQTWEDIKNWYKKPDILIGLQLKEDDLLLADSHKSYDKLEKEVRIEIVKNTNHYKDIIKKIEKQTKSIYEFDYNR